MPGRKLLNDNEIVPAVRAPQNDYGLVTALDLRIVGTRLRKGHVNVVARKLGV